MLEIKALSKKFKRKKLLKEINLTIPKGVSYALLGKNGVGKSTLIHLILDLIQLEEGSIQINGKAHDQLGKAEKAKIGVLLEDLALLEEVTGIEYLRFIGKIYQVPASELEQRITDLFKFFFEDQADRYKQIAKYSTGMKKKIAFCAVILHKPDLLILDEPFTGLDPFAANQLIKFIKHYQNEERAILISSHNLNYVEQLCTHLTILSEGELCYDNTLEEFTANGANTLDEALLDLLKTDDNDLTEIDWL